MHTHKASSPSTNYFYCIIIFHFHTTIHTFQIKLCFMEDYDTEVCAIAFSDKAQHFCYFQEGSSRPTPSYPPRLWSVGAHVVNAPVSKTDRY